MKLVRSALWFGFCGAVFKTLRWMNKATKAITKLFLWMNMLLSHFKTRTKLNALMPAHTTIFANDTNLYTNLVWFSLFICWKLYRSDSVTFYASIHISPKFNSQKKTNILVQRKDSISLCPYFYSKRLKHMHIHARLHITVMSHGMCG